MKKITKEECIKAIQSFYIENSKTPSTRDFVKNKKYPSPITIQKYLGSWDDAIKAAGYTPVIQNNYSKNQIINIIQQFYKEKGRIPVVKDFKSNPSHTTVQKHFGSWNRAIKAAGFTPVTKSEQCESYKDCSKEGIIKAIQRFYEENNRIPQQLDFQRNFKYPSFATVQRLFGTWNKAIEAAGFEPTIQNGFGTNTYGLDGTLYRSQAEAYFADKFLYEKYNYQVEPFYPNNSWMYDWYITKLDLYIELDGGCRPERTKEKIVINKQLDRECLVIKTKDIYDKHKLDEFM